MGQLQTITKITKQKQQSNRYNVFLNDKYAFSISEDVYVKFQIHKGKQLTKIDIENIKKADDFQRAYILAINYLSYRMRTEQEMRSFLQQKKLLNELVEKIISRLYEEKLLDDLEFAKSFVTDRLNRSTKGPLLIKRELMEKGIQSEHIEDALKQYSIEKEEEIALRWAQKEVSKTRKVPYKSKIERLKLKLIRRGFRQEIVNSTISKLHIIKDDEVEFLLLKKEADKLYTKYKRKYEGDELELRLKHRLYRSGFDLSIIEQYVHTLLHDI